MRAPVAGLIERKLDRPAVIKGNLSARLLSWRPEVTVEGLTIGNPQGIEESDFASAEKITLALDIRESLKGSWVFDRLAIDNPKVTLINKTNRNNYTFGDRTLNERRRAEIEKEDTSDGPPDPPKLPAVRNFSLRGGDLHVRDEVHKLTFDGKVEASETHRPDTEPFRLRGTGTLNGESFALLFKGGPLANVRLDKPYEFDADVQAGKTRGKARGVFGEPFDVASIAASLDIKGENLAHLYYLTNLALPFTPPYRFAAHVQTSERKVAITKLDGKIGTSDIKGDLTVHLKDPRPKLVGALRSESLNLNDLSPAVGKGVAINPNTGDAKDSVAPGALPPDKLLPTYKFEFDRLKVMDADLKLHAESVQTQRVPFKKVDIAIKLQNAVLTVDPMVFSLPQGNLAATARIDARGDLANSTLDMRFNDIKLDQFKGKDMQQAPFDGVLHARLQLTGQGNSVHEFSTHAEGTLSAVVPNGEIRQAFAELTGINVARGLGLLLADDKKRSGVRCGVATVDLKDGSAAIRQMVFDTDTVLIKGEGKVDLIQEELDIEIGGKPKKIQLVRLRTPVTLEGPIRKPRLGIDKSDTAKQAGIAGALGALFAPIAAALAFVDPGLAEDANCAELLAAAQAEAQAADRRQTQSKAPAAPES